MNCINLLQEIEQSRKEMIHLTKQHQLTSTPVIKCSQKLDALLNAYQNKLIK